MDGSGSGKSASYSIPNAHQCLGSYVFTDPKGELYDRTAGYLKEHGYDIKVLNLVRPQYSDGYNPLMHISSELDVDVIANTIVKGQKTDSGSDPYWDDMAEMLLKALIYYLIATRPEEEQNLASCAELVRAANKNGGSNLLSDLMSQLPYDHPARMYYKSIEIAPEKTYGSILSSLQSKLGKFDSKDIAELTSTDTINFEEIGSKKTAVYVISSDTHTAYDFLLTIFFSQMIQQLYDFADKNGFAMIFPMFPGGLMDKNDFNSYKLLEYNGVRYDNIFLAMIDELAERFPIDIDKIYLYGWSGGGQFVHRFLYVHLERLVAVVIGASGRPTYYSPYDDYYREYSNFERYLTAI